MLSPPGVDLRTGSGADVGAAKPVEHGVDPALLQPARKQVAKRVAGGFVRVLVAVDLGAAPPRLFQPVQQAFRGAPVVHAGQLDVDDLDVDTGLLGELDRLLDRIEDRVGLVPEMGEVARAASA